MPNAITANRLSDGLVVYRTAEGGWSTALRDAAVFADEAGTAVAIDAAKLDVLARLIVDPYAIVLDPTASVPRPKSLKESIRAFGPTIRYGAIPQLEAAE